MKINELSSKLRDGYQRDNFDLFIKKTHFDFSIPSIHVAGTNGKGTTSTYISSIIASSGKKVGLYISPYFYEINEMISINGIKIKDEEITAIYQQYAKEIEKYQLSEFEIETFIAFTYFKQQNCDFCVVECGMGGEFDGTNIFTPILSVITSISLEHTDSLGTSISEIALNKGGIIKPHVPCVVGNLPNDAIDTLVLISKKRDSKIIKISEPSNVIVTSNGIHFSYTKYNDLHLASCAYYSLTDACIALEALTVIEEKVKVNRDNILEGFKSVLPCRFERLDKNTIIDGGHNPEGIKLFYDSYIRVYNDKPTHIIYAGFKDKNIASILPTLNLISNDVVLTTFNHPRARGKDDYFLFSEDYKFVEDFKAHYNLLRKEFPDDYILFIGSLAFASVIRKLYFESMLIDG